MRELDEARREVTRLQATLAEAQMEFAKVKAERDRLAGGKTVLLFNGKDLQGWTVLQNKLKSAPKPPLPRVESGAIILYPGEATASAVHSERALDKDFYLSVLVRPRDNAFPHLSFRGQSIFNLVKGKAQRPLAAGSWHMVEVEVRGGVMTTWVNRQQERSAAVSGPNTFGIILTTLGGISEFREIRLTEFP
jgi:hypothetical protein